MAMPYMINVMREYTDRLETLEADLNKRKDAEAQLAEQQAEMNNAMPQVPDQVPYYTGMVMPQPTGMMMQPTGMVAMAPMNNTGGMMPGQGFPQ